MAKRQGPRNYHEPWVTTRSKAHGPCPASPEGVEPDEATAAVIAAWNRTDENADWIIWGSNLAEPSVCMSLLGTPVYMDDRRILAMSEKRGFPQGTPDHEDFARRIVACVNACAGIGNPESFITEIRQLLLEMVRKETDHHDSRVLSLMARCVPPSELEPFQDDDT